MRSDSGRSSRFLRSSSTLPRAVFRPPCIAVKELALPFYDFPLSFSAALTLSCCICLMLSGLALMSPLSALTCRTRNHTSISDSLSCFSSGEPFPPPAREGLRGGGKEGERRRKVGGEVELEVGKR